MVQKCVHQSDFSVRPLQGHPDRGERWDQQTFQREDLCSWQVNCGSEEIKNISQ